MRCCWVCLVEFRFGLLLYSIFVSKVKMPRKGAMLVLFLEKGLDGAKYTNLSCEDPIKKVLSLYLPRRERKLDRKYEFIFKDWYAKTGRKYIFFEDYTRAKQAMTAALRKSDYVELIRVCKATLTFRILNEEEVQAKKQQKKYLKFLKGKQQEEESDTSESGYDSGMNSPESQMDYGQNDEDLLRGIVHDHPYDKTSGEENGFQIDLQDICLEEDFSNIPELPEVPTMQDLDGIPCEELIGCFNKIQSEVQAPDLIGAKASVKPYICEKYELLDNGVLLICKLLQEEDVCIADTTSNIKIVFDEAMQEGLQGYSRLKEWKKIDDHNLMVILEPPFMSQR